MFRGDFAANFTKRRSVREQSAKTKLLKPDEAEEITITVDKYSCASFDDSGVTGNRNSYILEAGEYKFFLGTSVKKCEDVSETMKTLMTAKYLSLRFLCFLYYDEFP